MLSYIRHRSTMGFLLASWFAISQPIAATKHHSRILFLYIIIFIKYYKNLFTKHRQTAVMFVGGWCSLLLNYLFYFKICKHITVYISVKHRVYYFFI